MKIPANLPFFDAPGRSRGVPSCAYSRAADLAPTEWAEAVKQESGIRKQSGALGRAGVGVDCDASPGPRSDQSLMAG